MTELRSYLELRGFSNVKTLLASGNIILDTDRKALEIRNEIEKLINTKFKLESEGVKALVLSPQELKTIVEGKLAGFGEQPNKYHSDVIFLIDIGIEEALAVFSPKESVNNTWPGEGVIYSQRLSSQLSKSRLSKIVGTSAYKSMTIRSWNTVMKLLSITR